LITSLISKAKPIKPAEEAGEREKWKILSTALQSPLLADTLVSKIRAGKDGSEGISVWVSAIQT
jgi:hypothetical protein